MPPTEPLALASIFPPADREAWRAEVDRVLDRKGTLTEQQLEARFDKVLRTRLPDGFDVPPLLTREDLPDAADEVGVPGSAPYVRGATANGPVPSGWDVRQPLLLDPHDVEGTNAAALDDLEHGVSSLLLRPRPGTSVDTTALEAMLAGVRADLVALCAEDGVLARPLLDWWAAQQDPSSITGTLGLDPIGHRAVAADSDPAAELDRDWELVTDCLERHPDVAPLVVDATRYNAAGASDADELGCAIATGVAYLRLLTDRGLSIDAAAQSMEFRLAATVDQFSTIAKLRAARRLWARVTAEVDIDGPAGAMRQHAVASPAMLTRYDPWVNLLRGTVACMAAGVGGAQAVTVEAYDTLQTDGRPSPLGRRMARNTQTILIEESHLARVLDPAGGSYYVEWLTDRMARQGWAWMQEIEHDGGMLAALAGGMVAARIDATWQARLQRLATRAQPLTGVSEYPNIAEEIPPQPPGIDADTDDPTVLPGRRLATPYEELRVRADAHTRTTGRRPTVILANIGSPAEYTARSTFAKNLFEAGGLSTAPLTVDDEDPQAVIAEHGATIACLCSTDAVYGERGGEVADRLRASGITLLHVAGTDPGSAEVDAKVHLGCNALQILQAAHEEAGIA